MSLLLRQYCKVYRLGNWTRRHFTMAGHVLLTLMVAAAIFGVNTKQSTTYQVFVFLLFTLIFAWLNSLGSKLKVSLSRQLPRYGVVGEVLQYRVTLHNLTPQRYDALVLGEQLVETMPNLVQLRNFGHTPSWRSLSYRHWLAYLNYQRGGLIAETELPELAQTPLHIKISFTPTRRGTLHFADSYLAKPDLLGLFRRLFILPAKQSLLILPKHYPLKPLALAGKRKYQAGGVSLASSVGNSSEFMALRDYQRGDPLNCIHWKSYAKYGKLIVKEYQDEYFSRRALILDTFVGDAANEQFEGAVSVAASLAISEQHNEALLDLMFVGTQVYCFTAGRGVDHLPHLQEVLAEVQASDAEAFSQLQQAVLAQAELCNSLVCVLMHWDTERQDFIAQLQTRGLPVVVFLLHDGTLTKANCAKQPAQFYLLDYHHLAEELASL